MEAQQQDTMLPAGASAFITGRHLSGQDREGRAVDYAVVAYDAPADLVAYHVHVIDGPVDAVYGVPVPADRVLSAATMQAANNVGEYLVRRVVASRTRQADITWLEPEVTA